MENALSDAQPRDPHLSRPVQLDTDPALVVEEMHICPGCRYLVDVRCVRCTDDEGKAYRKEFEMYVHLKRLRLCEQELEAAAADKYCSAAEYAHAQAELVAATIEVNGGVDLLTRTAIFDTYEPFGIHHTWDGPVVGDVKNYECGKYGGEYDDRDEYVIVIPPTPTTEHTRIVRGRLRGPASGGGGILYVDCMQQWNGITTPEDCATVLPQYIEGLGAMSDLWTRSIKVVCPSNESGKLVAEALRSGRPAYNVELHPLVERPDVYELRRALRFDMASCNLGIARLARMAREIAEKTNSMEWDATSDEAVVAEMDRVNPLWRCVDIYTFRDALAMLQKCAK